MNKEEIFDYCKKISKKQEIEFSYQISDIQKSNLEKFNLNNFNFKENDLLKINVLVNSQKGNYTIRNITKKNIDKAINAAKKIAKMKNKLPIKELGSGTSSKKIKQDTSFNNLDFSEVLEKSNKEITKDKYFKSYEGNITLYNSYGFYMNPYTEEEYTTNFLRLDVLINAKHKKSSSGYFGNIFTKVKDINIKETFDQAKINTNNLLDPVNGKKGEYTLILVPEATKEFLEKFVIDATTGDVIEEKKSYLHKYLNKKVFSEKISIVEDPFLDYFTGSRVIDDQGFKTSRKNIITNGVFKKVIYDQYNAIKYNKKPTGNGEFIDGIEFTNTLQKPGFKKIETILKNIKNGILVYNFMGLHTNKITTGDFALVISSGKRIVNGEMKETITNLNFTGKVQDILKHVYFSKEQMFFGDSVFSFMIIPKVKLI